MPGRTRTLTGTVVSDKMDKTVVVLVKMTTRHRLYRKILKRSKRYMAHDDRLEAKTGDLVRIAEVRPLSRHKRWRVIEVVQRREVADVAPRDIDSQYITLQREREQPPAPAAKAADETVAEAPEAEANGTGEPSAAPVEADVASEEETKDEEDES